jgi:hypothetical protein
MESFDRYSQFRQGNNISLIPFGKIQKRNTDKYEIYIKGVTRIDLLSYKYYGNPDYGWQSPAHLSRRNTLRANRTGPAELAGVTHQGV